MVGRRVLSNEETHMLRGQNAPQPEVAGTEDEISIGVPLHTHPLSQSLSCSAEEKV